MIAQSTPCTEPAIPVREYLVRIGLYGEPLRCISLGETPYARHAAVVVATERGEMLTRVLQQLTRSQPAEENGTNHSTDEVQILREATAEDLAAEKRLRDQSQQDFRDWQQRINNWKVNVELVDLEWTLDGKRLMLYVLNDRGPESTKLALQAAAAGFGHVDVLPVTAEGLMPAATGKSSGGGGCGCGSGGGCH